MMRKGDQTTIIFINKNQQASKPVQIPTYLLLHWKKYVAGVFGCFVFLLGMVFYLALGTTVNQPINPAIASTVVATKNQIAAESIDTSLIKKYYLSIDEKLVKINKYLKARGIRAIPKGEGGGQPKELLSLKETGEFYENYLNKMVSFVARTPMGYPHHGAITSGYGYRDNPFTGENIETHGGLDIKGTYGQLVKSTADGKVTFAGSRGGYGNCIVISHGNGFETYYGHLSKILIREGQYIDAGQNIGKIGSTGRSTGPHLHYEIHRNGKRINPKSFLTLE